MNDYNFKSDLIINATTSQIDKPQTLRGDIMTRNTQMTEIQEVLIHSSLKWSVLLH